jgi:glycosyltransferase involved in cell wall biosynthesis
MTGVSFVVPVHNGATCVADTLASIVGQGDGRPLEIIVVEDGSIDESAALLGGLREQYALNVVQGPGRGAAAALNAGIRAATHPIVCQVDQDVVLEPGWMTTLLAALEDPAVAAAQGRYVADPQASFFARIMGLDLEQRYEGIGQHSDHVCTGNTAYRTSALKAVGLLDDSLGYGYDNDLSYRLQAAGYRLAFCPDARSRHRWREGMRGYLVQQYGFGYGRLDVVARHPARWTGDAVSPVMMMAHPALTGAAVSLLVGGVLSSAVAGRTFGLVAASVTILLALIAERARAGVRAWRRFNDPTALAFPVVHLARNGAWVAAVLVWGVRRALRRPFKPDHSMTARADA